MSLVNYEDSSDSDDAGNPEEAVNSQPGKKTANRIKRIKVILAFPEFNCDTEEPKKKPSKKKGSSLIELLPPPKAKPESNTSIIPAVLLGKRKLKLKAGEPTNISDSDEESGTLVNDDELWQKVFGRQKLAQDPSIPKLTPETPLTFHKMLDNQTFQKLLPTKRDRNFNLTDIHEDEIRSDKSAWLKSLTDPNFDCETSIESPVNNTCRIKNHITSLAQRALADDKKLQARWAESRHNRIQTRAKYGF